MQQGSCLMCRRGYLDLLIFLLPPQKFGVNRHVPHLVCFCLVLRQGHAMQSWLSWNSLCRSGYPFEITEICQPLLNKYVLPYLAFFFFLKIIFSVQVCMCVWVLTSSVEVRDNLQESVFFFYHVGPSSSGLEARVFPYSTCWSSVMSLVGKGTVRLSHLWLN